MQVRTLELTDFRSYDHADVGFGPGVTVLVGQNGRGKTNVLEAMYRVAVGGSHRVGSDQPLIRSGAKAAVIRVGITTDDARPRAIDAELAPGGRNRLRLDGQDVRRPADAIGVLRAVLFAPEDIEIVRGDPSKRRKLLDEVLSQRRKAYAATRSEYERVVRQRNQLLKQMGGLSGDARSTAARTLEAWTEQLIEHGASLVAARLAAAEAMEGPVEQRYQFLAASDAPVSLFYRWSGAGDGAEPGAEAGRNDWSVPDIRDRLRSALVEVAREELARRITLVGPHRDDLELSIGDLPARGYASHGELWSLVLGLRLACYDILAEVGDRPVVMLDDVFAELDETRRERLAELCKEFEQVLVTAAVEDDVPLGGTRMDVSINDGISSLRPRTAVQPAPAQDDVA